MAKHEARATAPAQPAEEALDGERGPGRGKYDRSLTAEERQTDQRMRLLDSSASVFAARGYAHTTVEAILEQAGMSRRTFYQHFRDVRDVLLKVHDQAAAAAYHTVAREVEAAGDPLERLRAGVSAFLRMLAEHGDLARVVFREVRAAGPEHEARRQAALSRYAQLLHRHVGEAYAGGFVTRPPDELTIFALVSAIEAVGMRYVERREESRAPDAAPLMVELVLRAFR